MGIDRKRRRVALKQRFKLLSGGKPPDSAGIVQQLSTADRLGAAINVLVLEFRKQPDPLQRADEVRILLDVAAKFAIDLDADAEQFANGAAFVYDEMEKRLAAVPPPEAG